LNFIYPWLLLILPLVGAAVLLGLKARRERRSRRRPLAGTRLANTAPIADLPAFFSVARQHWIGCVLGVTFALIAAVGSVALAARPADSQVVSLQQRTRDVVFCLDVSASMYPVDSEVIAQFREIVGSFEGERVAMSWFNSSSVTLFPLTDDYTYVDETLAPIEKQFQAVANSLTFDGWLDGPSDSWPDTSGTLLGEGSSLPGDGLVSCLQLFDQSQMNRPRSVILATDNVVEGSPIFELWEATAMAAEADVHLYAISPSFSAFGVYADEEEYFRASVAELREEIELVGGDFFQTDDYGSASEIVESILSGEAGEIEGPPRRVIRDRPAEAIAVVASGLVGLFIWGGWRGRRVVWIRRGSMVLLLGLMLWNPNLGVEKVTQQAVDADVIVLVDTSPSIAAEDWDGSSPRLDAIRADIGAIAAEHVGAHIAIVAFDSSARLIMPFSTDPGAALAAADTLTPVPYWWASGSSIDSGLDLLEELLTRQAEEHPERARLVYYLGDGEQTREGSVKSFEPVADLVDGGAVLGYGTAEGGRMLAHQETIMGELVAEPEYILAPDGSPGISKIDETALEMIASELGVDYLHRTAQAPVSEALWQGELPPRTVDDATSGSRPLRFLAAVALFGTLIWELAWSLPRARNALAVTRLGAARQATRRAQPWTPWSAAP
jgi:hypothetical protein